MILLNEPWREFERRRRYERNLRLWSNVLKAGAFVLIGLALGRLICGK